jgi:hypothetical protein
MVDPTSIWEVHGSFSKVLSLHPLLQWMPVEGASHYRITVRGPNLVWRADVGSVTKFLYPENAPELKPGVEYKLMVEADGQSAAAKPGLWSAFSVLFPEDRKAVAKKEKTIVDLGLPAGPTQFLIAHLYAAYGLNAESIQQLEDTSQSFQAPAVARLLGDLYLGVRFTRRAEASYLNSLRLSQDDDDEGRMLAHKSLAIVYDALRDTKQAVQHLDAVLALANKLGDKETASEAETRLTELKNGRL